MKHLFFKLLSLLTLFLFCLTMSTANAQDNKTGKNPWDRQVFFGEQHLHTVNSADAFAFGTRTTPDEAYKFLKGEPIMLATTGETVQRRTPYDWGAVTDHAEYLGSMPMMMDPDSPIIDTPLGKMMAAGKGDEAFGELFNSVALNEPIEYMMSNEIMGPAWQKQIDAANKHNDPGKFTTLIAFEWTSQPNYMNLHHNVFFRDDIGPKRVFSALDSEHMEDLWSYQEHQRSLGHENFSVPHNSNMSNGAMFSVHTSDGNPIDARWAKRSARNSPLVEIIQTKGASETNPALAPSDEFAAFEQDYKHQLGSGGLIASIDRRSFVRNALTDGVGLKEMLGVNPFKYGIVSGADSHDGAPANEEFNYFGIHGAIDATAEIRLTSTMTPSGEPPIVFGSAGTTAVWADENTRTGIFDALKRKESYGTSGTLIRVRFFGGWGYDDNITKDKDFVKNAYAGGVPMGGDLPAKPDNIKAPTFAVWALKDPQSGNLDRIQIIKGWYDSSGNPREKIYDIVWSGDRSKNDQGKLPPVGNTVDLKTAKYSNTIGQSQLMGVWTDQDFDPAQHAVYYARVIEIPTPRWSTYDAVKTGLPLSSAVPPTIQERAWTSAIWYTPAADLVNKKDFYPGLVDKLRPSNFDETKLTDY